ncbi:MAG: DNA-binding protein [Simkaniaceae bacterium]|nr:MAG: DNA-binding protein [Simkaniaceae bacterium]
MKFADYTKGYVLKLEPGEELHETLIAFATKKRIPSAFFQGIGGLTNIELGYFNRAKNDYERRHFDGDYELVCANGNISDVDGKHFAHTHVVISDEKFQTFSGHFFKGIITITAEIFLFPIDIAMLRKPDEKLNFHGLDLPHHFVR